jgi:hypothetical protein
MEGFMRMSLIVALFVICSSAFASLEIKCENVEKKVSLQAIVDNPGQNVFNLTKKNKMQSWTNVELWPIAEGSDLLLDIMASNNINIPRASLQVYKNQRNDNPYSGKLTWVAFFRPKTIMVDCLIGNNQN